jgi:hypothetical protein
MNSDKCLQCGLLYCNCIFISKQEYKEALEQEKKRKEEEEQDKEDAIFKENCEKIKDAQKLTWDIFSTLKQSGEAQLTPCWTYLSFQDLFALLFPELAKYNDEYYPF